MKYYSCRKEDIGKSVAQLLFEKEESLPDMSCAGRGICGKCKMKLKGNLSDADVNERDLLGSDFQMGMRLACRARVLGDFEYEAQERLKAEIETGFKKTDMSVSCKKGSAIAIDIGSTTVAIYKCNAENGEITDKTSFVNPQRVHGADVISRLVFAEAGGADTLSCEINSAIGAALDEIGCENTESFVVCGNTAMQHFLCGEDSRGIARLPFSPATLFGEEYELGFCKKVYVAPCIAAYVGGDITLGALACDIDRVQELTLYIDIGTNGEIVLADKERILCCAAAAGPAFEGGNIECGMMAAKGAVCRVYLKDSSLCFDTVGNEAPKGICGSGLIDAAASLLELALMDETGMLCEDKVYLSDRVYISRKDIRALQSAKAAIAAGVRTLCSEMGCRVSDIKKVIIAGGFGSHIDPESAKRIGLIPYGCNAEIEFGGNCAGMGAVKLALDMTLRPRLKKFCERMEYTELSGHKGFNEYYIDEMYFEE